MNRLRGAFAPYWQSIQHALFPQLERVLGPLTEKQSLAVEHTGAATLVPGDQSHQDGYFLDSEGCSPPELWHHCGNIEPQ